MMLKYISIVLGVFIAANSASAADSDCYMLDGAAVIANDDEYLGKVENSYASDSIFNEYGRFGSEYQPQSPWNNYGSYGSEYSYVSPMNAYTKPARMIKNETYRDFSVNQKDSILNPKILKALCSDM